MKGIKDIMAEKHCTGCENACPISTLSCDRGRELNGIVIETRNTETLAQKLIRVGAEAKRIGAELVEWDMSEDMLVDCINLEQKNQLSAILDILDTDWKKHY